MKDTIKHILGFFRGLFSGIKNRGKSNYIGKNVHIVNGKNIKIGNGIQIRSNCDLFAGEVFEIGNYCDIGIRNRIVGNIIIGNSVLFGPDNYISSEDHCYENVSVPIINQGTYSSNNNGHSILKIGDGSWIGTHCAIIGDVHIGKHCVIGANSVVTKDIPDFCVAVGMPAKVIKKYNHETQNWEKV